MASEEKLKICLATSEFAPFAKTGGLADVTSALSAYLHRNGHEVCAVMPHFSRIDKGGYDIKPVEQLQDLTVRIGPWDVEYSVNAVKLPRTSLEVFLIDCPVLYGRESIYTNDDDEHLRFLLLTRASFEICQRLGFAPDIFSAHDWQTALMPLYLRTIYAWDKLFADTRSVLTIHNIGYQGVFPSSALNDLTLGDAVHHLHQDDLQHGRINFLKTGVLYANRITTVSPRYAKEIQGPEYGVGLDGLLRERRGALVGILNGVDYEEWDPETDTLIPHNFGPGSLDGKMLCKVELMREMSLTSSHDAPLIGIVSRLVGQKGFDLVENVLPRVLSQRHVSLAVLGSGEPRYETFFSKLQRAFPGRVSYYRGYNNRLAHWIEAGADIFLMPSLYEPCGLNQMYSLKYGTVPVVRETGGLADSVEMVDPRAGTGTGILFRDYNNDGLAWALTTALNLYSNPKLWKQIMLNGMAKDFSWDEQGAQYVSLFQELSSEP
ncbi:MAG: glycogen synthase [Woeseiaceae bacterium]|nr:glycogen synthase [Woeseiaceae bacterium]